MKTTKSIICLVLCLALCFCFVCPAFADGEGAKIALSLDITEITAGTATTITMFVGTAEGLVPVSFNGEAYADNARITISAINDGDKELNSSTTTGRFAWMNANNKANVSNWAEIVFDIPADLETGVYTLGVNTMEARDSSNTNLMAESSKTITFTVKPATVAVSGVSLDATSADMTVGDEKTLTATVSPADATNKTVTWESSDTDVATVENGVVKAVKAGEATITATTVDGKFTATCTVTVNPAPPAIVPVTGVELDATSANMTVGDEKKLTATVSPDNATNKTVKWSSSNPAVATVNDNGKITAVGVGTAIITATTVDGKFTDTCTVTVTAEAIPVTGVTLDKGSFNLPVGKTRQLTATVIPSNATIKKVEWTSSNPAVATVDANGYVTALSEGEANITVTVDGKTATCKVTVTAAENYTDAREYYALMNIPTVYRLTFKTNGGSAIKDVFAPRGTAIHLNTFVPEKEGYAFDGWFEDEALTKPLTTWKVVSNKTVYAAWTDEISDVELVELPFIDVFESDSFYSDVEYVYMNGLMNGVADILFAPEKTLSRAMIVTILYRLEGEPAFMNDNIFTDVEADSWYEKAVVWANGKGIVLGYGDGTFGPNNNVTREQMAAILYRYAEYKGYDVSADETVVWAYEDAESIDDWALNAMQWACGSMLLDDTDGCLRPVEDATRAEVAVLLHRFCVAIED